MILAVSGLALTAPAALADSVYFHVGIDGRGTASVSLDDWEPRVTRVELVRGGAVVGSGSGDSVGLPFASIRTALQAGDVLNIYRDSWLLGSVPYSGRPTVNSDMCAGRNSFTVQLDDGAKIDDASYWVPGAGGYGNWARSIWTQTNPSTVTIDREMVLGGVIDVTTWRHTMWRGTRYMEIYQRRETTVPACPQPAPAPVPPVVPVTPTDVDPDAFAPAFANARTALGKLKLAKLARKRSFTLNFAAPKPGTVKLNLTTKAKGKTTALGSGSAKATKAGSVKVTIKLSKKAQTLIKRSKRLKVTFTATFTPTGAKPIQKSAAVTLKK